MQELQQRHASMKKSKNMKLKTQIKAGPNRRAFDHIGNFNFATEPLLEA
jgi:hypothetical protein